DSTCQRIHSSNVVVHSVYADFSLSDTLLCSDTNTIIFNSTSPYADHLNWDLGDGNDTTILTSFAHTYFGAGVFPITLTILNDSTGCSDSATKTIKVGIYDLDIVSDTTLCLGDSLYAFANSSQPYTYEWRIDSGYLNSTTISNPSAYSDKDFILNVDVTDTNNCVTSKSVDVDIIQNGFVNVLSPLNADTAVVPNEPVEIVLQGIPFQGVLSYSWTPSEGLSCTDCPNPVANVAEPSTFEVVISDEFGCWSSTRSVFIDLAGSSTLDVPTAFTPNNDGKNDVVYVRGWGIKELTEFKIYNRWGELVYENPGNLMEGWDGTYKGKIQNPDTYAVIASGIGFDDQVLHYKGSLNILK
ncbi:MAG: gliding motility-associated C-terminal domain-containing protein, partial [Flavobacteriales bacterium]|nr:gliding motility-associated C-terminal domain-containing protein [Flavobacteriales bacterium]